ncbi:disks large-associated protein 4 isoform X2 [Tachysurus vachellii]|uniref:disks large-associated protein 4 isoform X2 n=1 Tax=Tachysurus vachellii TaxID=175792 RepID=UPI00296B2A5C|nr:disks large-associated protein 4 isoform X2 [Tachysurus vachellii]
MSYYSCQNSTVGLFVRARARASSSTGWCQSATQRPRPLSHNKKPRPSVPQLKAPPTSYTPEGTVRNSSESDRSPEVSVTFTVKLHFWLYSIIFVSIEQVDLVKLLSTLIIRSIYGGKYTANEDCTKKNNISTCITTCKKIAPPPVPPRNSNSKPFISVTVQSSTESAQDGYLDNHDRKSQTNSSSSDSSLTKGSRSHPPVLGPRDPQIPAAVVLSPDSSRELQNEQVKAGGATDEPRTEPVPRRKLSSIGIQVDSIQEIQNRVETPPPLARFQSIGVQVEDGWTLSRSSSMASKQETDSDTQDLSLNSVTSLTSINTSRPAEKKVMVNSASQSVDFHAQISLDNGSHDDDVVTTSGPSRQLLTNRSTTRSSSSSFSESLDPALDPSSLPPPDPWLESGNGTGNGGPTHTSSAGMSACRRDGHWFMKLLQAETARMEGWCKQMEEETKEHQLSEEVLGKVRSAVGSAQLLMSQKFQQFRGLCEQNLNVNANPRPTAQDLAGFWDLLQLSIEDISLKFDELYQLKANDWKLDRDSPDKQNQKQAPPVPKKPGKNKAVLNREKSSETADKQRQEARKRLMAAKRAQSVKQNSATESSDNIEIYVPEAQTRL